MQISVQNVQPQEEVHQLMDATAQLVRMMMVLQQRAGLVPLSANHAMEMRKNVLNATQGLLMLHHVNVHRDNTNQLVRAVIAGMIA